MTMWTGLGDNTGLFWVFLSHDVSESNEMSKWLTVFMGQKELGRLMFIVLSMDPL
jgi:hypothetical protein